MQRMDSMNSNNLPFMKMHGLGNDFVVIDAREGEVALSKKIISGIADRHFGVGFDQLAVICLLYTSPSPRDRQKSRMPSSA